MLGYYGRNTHVQKFITNFPKDKVTLGENVIYNLDTLQHILMWNIKNDIYFYRFVIEQIYPLYDTYPLYSLPNWNVILEKLQDIGRFVVQNNIRLTTHPSLFNVLGSEKKQVIWSSVKRLDSISIFMDLMGLPANDFYCMNIHVGSAFDGKENSLNRFVTNFKKLYDTTRQRVVVENDDKPSMFSVKDLMYLHKEIQTPITFDFLHHTFHSDGLTEKEAYLMAYDTWKTVPKVHITSSVLNENNAEKNPRKHANFLYEVFNDYNKNVYMMIESALSLEALLKYRKWNIL